MRLIHWEAHIKTPAGDTVLIIEASRPSTALSRAVRYMESQGWQVPRIHQSGLNALWGYIALYRTAPGAVAKGEQKGPHIWLIGSGPEEVL